MTALQPSVTAPSRGLTVVARRPARGCLDSALSNPLGCGSNVAPADVSTPRRRAPLHATQAAILRGATWKAWPRAGHEWCTCILAISFLVNPRRALARLVSTNRAEPEAYAVPRRPVHV